MTGRRLDYPTFRVDIGVTDLTRNSRLFTVTSTTRMFHAAACCVFSTHRHPASTSPAHPVSVPIRHASDKSSVVTSFETGICIHRKYNKIPSMIHTRYILMRVASGLFSCEVWLRGSWHFQVGSFRIQSIMAPFPLHTNFPS